MIDLRRLFFSFYIILLIPTVTLAQNANSSAFNSYTEALQKNGYRAKLDTSNKDFLHIETSTQGSVIFIVFPECKEDSECNLLELVSYLDCSETVEQCSDVMKSWQNEENFSGIIQPEGTKMIALYHYIKTDKELVSSSTLTASIEQLASDVVIFSRSVNEAKAVDDAANASNAVIDASKKKTNIKMK